MAFRQCSEHIITPCFAFLIFKLVILELVQVGHMICQLIGFAIRDMTMMFGRVAWGSVARWPSGSEADAEGAAAAFALAAALAALAALAAAALSLAARLSQTQTALHFRIGLARAFETLALANVS